MGTVSSRAYFEGTNFTVTGIVSRRKLEGTIFVLDRILSVTATTEATALHFSDPFFDAYAATIKPYFAAQQDAVTASLINQTLVPTLNAQLLSARGWIFP